MHEDDPFQPATLVIACEGFAALHVQHETGEIIARVNAFLGFARDRPHPIVQKAGRRCRGTPQRPRPRSPAEEKRLAGTPAEVEDEGLRGALERLGRTILGLRKNRNRGFFLVALS